MAETADLKSLAQLIFERDIGRDTRRDRLSRSCLDIEGQPRQLHRMGSADMLGVYTHDFRELERRCPDHIGIAEWHQAVEDGRRFLVRWRRPAEALGWDARDLFGLPPPSDKLVAGYDRLSRVELVGLIWLLRGRPVVALTATGAAIRATSGSILTYSRRPSAMVVLR
jgi:hypothetical protein